VRRIIHLMSILLLLVAGSLAMIGAVPRQGGVPPQPYNADYFSGRVYLGSELAPAGTQMLACVDTCEVFETETVNLNADGTYNLLAIHPQDQSLRGRPISFYLMNQHGRIKATEIAYFEGGFNAVDLDLSFEGPLPLPPVAPELPPVGDPIVPHIPMAALGLGLLSLVAGLVLLVIRGKQVRSVDNAAVRRF